MSDSADVEMVDAVTRLAAGNISTLDSAERQFITAVQQFNPNMGSSSPFQCPLPSNLNAVLYNQNPVFTGSQQLQYPNGPNETIPVFGGPFDVMDMARGEYATVSSSSQSSISQGDPSATPRSVSFGSMAPPQPERDDHQPSAPFPKTHHQPGERHATGEGANAEWPQKEEFVFKKMHFGRHARKGLKKIRTELSALLGIAVMSASRFSKLQKEIKGRLFQKHRQDEAVNTLEPKFNEVLEELGFGTAQIQNEQQTEITMLVQQHVREGIAGVLQDAAFIVEAARVSQPRS